MKNNHDVEVYDNGYGYRIALEIYTGTRISLTVQMAQELKESLEYGLARCHLTPATPDSEGRAIGACPECGKIYCNHTIA